MDIPYMASDPPSLKLPREFLPPYGHFVPESIYLPTISTRSPFPLNRFIRAQNPRELLICTEGTSFHNDEQPNKPKAGCAFMVNETGGWYRFPLEENNQKGKKNTRSARCASIRAAIAAIQCRNWAAEGFQRLIIATSDVSVVDGITSLMRGWIRDGWCYRYTDVPVEDEDLWWCLMYTIHAAEKKGCTVYFWATNGCWNKMAIKHAGAASEMIVKKAYEKVSLPSLRYAPP
ncbi:ribonuclease H-like protein [Penicillium tannophilum]|nr:ribonuclease H-like protein [Penicillium tannophilum]